MPHIHSDLRLIEDYLPIQAISKEASREKSVRKGHISTLHLWWARRPLVACRAAVYGALVPADLWVKEVNLKNPPPDAAKAEAMKNGAKKGLNRRAAGEFVTALCKYPGDPRVIEKAQGHILDAHADRLTAEVAEGRKTGKMPAWVEEFKWPACAEASAGRPAAKQEVTRADIEAGRAPRPRVLDMFAGGGAIPLEALRLGCEAYALDLNPVAHIIELCTLVYPQKYGRPDPAARGMTGPKNAKGETTWGGLAEEVRYWGRRVLRQVRKEIGDLYPPIPDPEFKGKRPEIVFDRETGYWIAKDAKAKPAQPTSLLEEGGAALLPPGYLMPVAYLWTRTVKCKNPTCGAIVPLVGQTWLCKKPEKKDKKGRITSPGHCVAIKMTASKGAKQVRFGIVEAESEEGLGFNPAGFSEAGNATCPFCNTVADSEYVKEEGCEKRLGEQLMATACVESGKRGKTYLGDESAVLVLGNKDLARRLGEVLTASSLTVPSEPIITDAKNSNWITLYGFADFGQIFTSRQLICLLTFAKVVRASGDVMSEAGLTPGQTKVLRTYMGLLVDRQADYNSSGCIWESGGEFIKSTFSQKGLPLTWDFVELAPFGGGSGSPAGAIDWIASVLQAEGFRAGDSHVLRGSALSIPLPDCCLDAVVTDPPYYDNIPYADIADFFYVWLKRTIGDLYPEHFGSHSSPKKAEAVADATRHGGDRGKAKKAYEDMMQTSFAQAARCLKAEGQMAVVYAHKTTLGWATLVDAMRNACFTVTEAWPLDTERPGRVRAIESAALASSIFLVARKREADAGTGSYETDVRPDLEQIVRERVKTLWEMDISGADLVIACVGAGLRAFTRYKRVEFANGEEVPAERFLMEVETAVLETILARLSKEAGGNGSRAHGLGGVDPATRFYILWRYTYRLSELDAGEAIIFANGTHVELDGPHGLSSGGRPLVEKKKSKYRLRDYSERGQDERLGMPAENGQAAPLVDVLHRVLWLMENRPGQLEEFFRDARPNLEQVRLVAQALAGPALKGGELGEVSPSKELAALKILTSNWRSIAEAAGPLFGQKGNGK